MKLPLKTTVLLAATLCAAGAVQAQTKIKIADSFPVGHYLPKYFTTPMMERLKANPAAKGLEFEYYPAEQMGKAKDFLSLVQSGVIDIAYVAPGFVSDKMPLSVVSELPRLGLPAVLSIDTRHAEVAARLLDLGFRVLNLAFPQHLFSPELDSPGAARLSHLQRQRLLAGFDAIVVMHSRGTPANMRELTDYDGDLCDTVCAELSLAARMLTDDSPSLLQRIIYDPGIGFAKTAEQSLTLLRSTERLKAQLERPLLVGCSRKSLWGTLTGQPVDSRLIPSLIGAVVAAQAGASIVRVHDVAETKLALLTHAALSRGRPGS